MKKELNGKEQRIAIFTIVIIALFITIVGIEIITMNFSYRNNNNGSRKYVSTFRHYDVDDSKFLKIIPADEERYIVDLCKNGCNLKAESMGATYYYMILKNNKGYTLNIILNNQIILFDKYIGNNIEKSYFKKYLGYTLFYNEIDDGKFIYDYANVVNNNTTVDEFTSLYNNEFELTNDGIVYYYDICADATNGGPQKVKAIRKPFTVNPKVINVEYLELTWC